MPIDRRDFVKISALSGLALAMDAKTAVAEQDSSLNPMASQAKPITREELSKQPLIMYRHSSITARRAKAFFQELDLVPNVMMEIGSIEAIKELVKLNLGVSILAPWTADRELSQGSLKMRPLGSRRLIRSWVIVSLAGRRLTLAEENFCKLCRRQVAGMRLDRRDVPALKA